MGNPTPKIEILGFAHGALERLLAFTGSLRLRCRAAFKGSFKDSWMGFSKSSS